MSLPRAPNTSIYFAAMYIVVLTPTNIAKSRDGRVMCRRGVELGNLFDKAGILALADQSLELSKCLSCCSFSRLVLTLKIPDSQYSRRSASTIRRGMHTSFRA